MATREIDTNVLGSDVSFTLSGPWSAYWLFFLRVLTGWWMLHAGLTKLLEGPFQAGGYLEFATAGTVVGPVTTWIAGNAVWLPNMLIPIGEFLIGLGVLVGCMTRLASFFGAFLMVFFYFGNSGWAHGMFSGDMMGMLLFMTLAVFGAGRVMGIDQYLEKTNFVKNNRWLRYLLG
jgi:thiosulfate dehydrogenase [quinone] large subunit